VTAAKLFARDRHHGQEYGGQPYVESHVAKVVSILKELGFDGFYQAAGWLHDVIEDTETTREEVERSSASGSHHSSGPALASEEPPRSQRVDLREDHDLSDASDRQGRGPDRQRGSEPARAVGTARCISTSGTFHETGCSTPQRSWWSALEAAYDS
jgi:hypothetical protein